MENEGGKISSNRHLYNWMTSGFQQKKTYILIQHIIKMGQINPEGRGHYIYGP